MTKTATSAVKKTTKTATKKVKKPTMGKNMLALMSKLKTGVSMGALLR